MHYATFVYASLWLMQGGRRYASTFGQQGRKVVPAEFAAAGSKFRNSHINGRVAAGGEKSSIVTYVLDFSPALVYCTFVASNP